MSLWSVFVRTLIPGLGVFWLSCGGPPAFADVDLSGSWGERLHHDFFVRIPGPVPGDFTGLPINAAARRRAESWDDAHWSVPEHQCEAQPADVATQGPASMRVWSEVDPKTQQLTAWHMVYVWQNPHRVIWMDGRAHPPDGAPHTWMGFSTGRWVGDILVVTTTHLKAGWVRRNGVPRSDLAKLTEYWIRHGDHLSVVSVVEDPVYLTAPFIRTANWVLDLGYDLGPYVCSPKAENDLPKGFVAHQLPGTRPALQEPFIKFWKLPLEAANGGEQTMYPEFAAKLAGRAVPATSARFASRSARATSKHPPAAVRAAADAADPREIRVLPVRDNIFVLMSSSGNTTVQTGEDGVLLVDTQRAELSGAILEKIQKLSTLPIRNIINTSAAPRSTGGNERIAKAGQSVGSMEPITIDPEIRSAAIHAHENVLGVMSAGEGELTSSTAAWPTDVYFTPSSQLHFNRETVEILHMPAAHSDGDSIVHFRGSAVVSAGNLFLTTGYPVIDLQHGGSINGLIEALNRIIDITVPAKNEEGGTLVIPGRGRISDEYEVVAYRDMITIIRDRVKDMMHRGFTLEQVLAARPTEDYDGRYDTKQEPWTATGFVEAVYRTLASGGDT